MNALAAVVLAIAGLGGVAWGVWRAIQSAITNTAARREADAQQRRAQAAGELERMTADDLAKLQARNTATEGRIVESARVELSRPPSSADVEALIRESKGEP